MELRTFSKTDHEEVCTVCEGCGLYRGKLCSACNGHGLVLVHRCLENGDVKTLVHDYEPTHEVQQLMQRGLLAHERHYKL